MKCPTCHQEMNVHKKDVTNNREKESGYKEYQRTVYVCEKDDAWITVETPKN